MSSRNQVIVESPVAKFLTWKTQYDENENPIGGTLVWYDKEAKKDVPYALPFSFALIDDDAVTFKGYNEATKEGVWSNEGYRPNHEIVLKSKTETLLKFNLGDYKKVKDQIKGFGAKYTKVIYCAVKPGEEGNFALWAITLSGAGLTGGVDMDNFDPTDKMRGYFNATKNIGKTKMIGNMIVIASADKKKKGKTNFYVPNFEVGNVITEEENNELKALNNKLTEYRKFYYNKPKDEVVETAVAETTTKEPWDE